MYLKLSNFRGRTSAGGTSLGPKTGTSVGWGGGLAQFLPDGGNPPVPPGKNPGYYAQLLFFVYLIIQFLLGKVVSLLR